MRYLLSLVVMLFMSSCDSYECHKLNLSDKYINVCVYYDVPGEGLRIVGISDLFISKTDIIDRRKALYFEHDMMIIFRIKNDTLNVYSQIPPVNNYSLDRVETNIVDNTGMVSELSSSPSLVVY